MLQGLAKHCGCRGCGGCGLEDVGVGWSYESECRELRRVVRYSCSRGWASTARDVRGSAMGYKVTSVRSSAHAQGAGQALHAM